MLTGFMSFPIRAMLGIVASTPNEPSSLFFDSSAKKRRKHKKKKKDKRLWDGKRYNWCYRKDLIKKADILLGFIFELGFIVEKASFVRFGRSLVCALVKYSFVDFIWSSKKKKKKRRKKNSEEARKLPCK